MDFAIFEHPHCCCFNVLYKAGGYLLELGDESSAICEFG